MLELLVISSCSERKAVRHPDQLTLEDFGEWLDGRAPSIRSAASAGPPRARTNSSAVGSFLFALLGGGLGAIPALVLGARARREIRDSNGAMRGEGWAFAGLAHGGLQVVVLSVVLVAVLHVYVWGPRGFRQDIVWVSEPGLQHAGIGHPWATRATVVCTPDL
jgi:hypothetical protein